jgi:sulfoacetaldehyde acetyltransferase
MRVSGSEALVEALRLEGVTNICGIVGSAFMDPLDLFPAAGIRFIQVRHEQSAALMAEGYSRASGGVGVCIGQNGPGITNLVTGVASAYLNHTPLVVLTPAVLSSAEGTGAFQEVDQLAMLAPVTVWQGKVNRPERMAEVIRSAFRAAHSLRGPVQVDIPRDMYYADFEMEALTPNRYRTNGEYGGANRAAIEDAIFQIRKAKRPAIVCGLGIGDRNAFEEVRALARLIGAPVATVYLHNDCFDNSDPLYVGALGYQGSQFAMSTLSNSDLIIALGTRLNAFGTTPQYGLDFYPKTAALIQNSINPMDLGALRSIDVGLLGDCKEVTQQLIDGLRGFQSATPVNELASTLETGRNNWRKKLSEMSVCAADSTQPMTPRSALEAVAGAVPMNGLVVADVGNISGAANAYFDRFSKPRSWFAAGSLGGIGVGFPTGLGVKLARPGEPVFTLVGDGAWSMSMQEVMTAVREKLNLITIIFNNKVYGAERRNQFDFFKERYFYTDLENPSFADIATTMGARGFSVSSISEIKAAMQEAMKLDIPSVIEVHTDPKLLNEPYRRDALKQPMRFMDRYQ